MDKEQIIKRLQEEAGKNGGTPPGKAKFEKLTDIAESLWAGKYWARWSDLVSDAGFSAGQMQQAIPESELLSVYVSYVRELGKVPTIAELRLKAFNTEGFPAHSTFTRNSSQKLLVGRAIKFCEQNSSYSDLLPILESAPHEFLGAEDSYSPSPAKNGRVYLLKFGDNYKIGNSNNVQRRFQEIKTQMPESGEIVHTIETGDPEGIERYWHGFFSGKNTKGEWFRLTAADVSYFKKRRLM